MIDEHSLEQQEKKLICFIPAVALIKILINLPKSVKNREKLLGKDRLMFKNSSLLKMTHHKVMQSREWDSEAVIHCVTMVMMMTTMTMMMTTMAMTMTWQFLPLVTPSRKWVVDGENAEPVWTHRHVFVLYCGLPHHATVCLFCPGLEASPHDHLTALLALHPSVLVRSPLALFK